MGRRSRVAIDSQCLSYLIDALSGIGEPMDELSGERIALFRIYLYSPWTFSVTPTVESEYKKIAYAQRRDLHDHFVSILFETFDSVPAEVEKSRKRVVELSSFHSGVSDCKVIAECEALEQEQLLTYDFSLIRKLDGRCSVKLAKPSEFWDRLAIPKGATPEKCPHLTNPLALESWWVW